MIVLSHRGYWKEAKEKNTPRAFHRSFSLGFGTETDIRDYNGELVISHDIADENCVSVSEFFKIYNEYDKSLPLALNIKSDGLQGKLKDLLWKYSIDNYFLFDMSVPDAVVSVQHGLKIFSRESEYETVPSLYEEACGIWLDEFHGHWINQEVITKHHIKKKKVCIVSPDLHKREYKKEWEEYRYIENETGIADLMICTDFPEQAKEFFYEKK